MTRKPESGYDSQHAIAYTVTNTLTGGTVTVSNTVINGSTVLPFTYRVKATLTNGKPLVGEVDGLTFDSLGEAVFTLKHGEQKQLLLPVSVQVEVSQDTMPGYTTDKQTVTGEAEPVPMKARATNGDRAGSVTVKFTNDLSFTVYGLKTIDGQKPNGKTFTFRLLGAEGTQLAETTNDADGSFTFSPKIGLTDQSELTLTLYEVGDAALAEDYVLDTEPKEVTVTLPTEGGVTVSADEEHPVTVNNRATTSVTVYKTWSDGADRNIAGYLTLYANGEKVSGNSYVVTPSDGNYAYTFSGQLPERDEKGFVITYSVKESAPSGYMVVYPGDQDRAYDGDTIRNVLAMQLTVTKVWKNVDKNGKQPITLELYKDGELYRTYEREPNDSGVYTFTIPYDINSDYWFVEQPVKNYKTTYENPEPYGDVTDRVYSGGTITNTGKLPHTGDNTPVLALSLAALLSLTGLVLLRRRKR